jgi:hypothetical protein
MAANVMNTPAQPIIGEGDVPVSSSHGEQGGSFLAIGYWAALVCGVGALAYGAVSIAVAIVATSAITYEGYAAFTADYSLWPTFAVVLPPLVVTLAFPVLVTAIYVSVRPERRPLGILALFFAGIYTAILGPAYWLQITYVPWNVMRGAGEEIAPWIMWNPASFFWGFETFAYFAMGLACLFAGLAFVRGQVPRRIRSGLLAMGVLGVYFLSAALKDSMLNPAGTDAWVTVWSLSAAFLWFIVFGFVGFFLAGWFGRQRASTAAAPAAGILGERMIG